MYVCVCVCVCVRAHTRAHTHMRSSMLLKRQGKTAGSPGAGLMGLVSCPKQVIGTDSGPLEWVL